jgi:hypothetical protein
MMIISAQFAESGFIDLCARTITECRRAIATGDGLGALVWVQCLNYLRLTAGVAVDPSLAQRPSSRQGYYLARDARA